MSAPPAEPIVLASSSPQRTAILEQLRIPHEIVPPDYEEDDRASLDVESLVLRHAVEKARSVARLHPARVVLGVDTLVLVDGRILSKPESAAAAEQMLETLSGKAHSVVSGLSLITPAWEENATERTAVRFRTLNPRDIAHYVAAGEWRGRAGGYAIQGLGASLVAEVEGDYLNVVGLPAATLVRILAERFPGTYGFG